MKKWFRRFIDGAWILSLVAFIFVMLAVLTLYFPIATTVVIALFMFVCISTAIGFEYEKR